MTKKLTYQSSGVDIKKADEFIGAIKGLVKSTRQPGVMDRTRAFGSLFALPKGYKEPVLVSSTDGVGTKLLVANKVGKHDTVGIDLGNDIRIDFLYPIKSLVGGKIDNLNNSSIVNRLVYGDSSVLFTGDLEKDSQDEMIAANPNIKSNILKVPHHGSKDATNPSLIKAVSPQFAVIEVGKNNKFGHPTATALQSLVGIQVFRTDQDGDVTFNLTKTSVNREK